MTMTLHLQTVPARNGLLWIRHAFKVWQRKPLALTGLFSFSMFSALLLSLLPFGGLLLVAALPLMSLGFMLATHLVLQDKTPSIQVFAAPFKVNSPQSRTQLTLCAAYAASALVMALVLNWVDGATMDQAIRALQKEMAREKPDGDAMNAIWMEPAVLKALGWHVLASTLLAIPFWHAPALVHWGGQGAMQALFSSTLGLWRNRGAFSVNAMAWAGLIMGLSLLISGAALVLGPLLLLPLLALVLLLPTLFYASLYFTFIDCFMFGAPRDLLSK